MKNYTLLACLICFYTSSYCQNVVQAEYFIDTDSGLGQNTLVNLNSAADGSFSFSVNLAGITAGYHKLYIRVKDSDGKWSQTTKRNIEVAIDKNNLYLPIGEFFFDIDPGFGLGTSVNVTSANDTVVQAYTATVAALQPGYHKLYMRFRDANSQWSFTARRNVDVFQSNASGNIIMTEYFFNTDPGVGNGTPISFATPNPDGIFGFTVPQNAVPAGTYKLYLRTRDDNPGNWSLTQTPIPTVLPLTFMNFNAALLNSNVQLDWQTANEVNVSYFNIQRSIDALNFETINKSAAQGNVQNNYRYIDDITGIKAGNIYYRLQSVDRDNKINYSAIKTINYSKQFNVALYPNPVTGNILSVSIHHATSNVVLNIYSLDNTLFYSQKLSSVSGHIEREINISALPAGIYFVYITDGTNTQTMKLIKQ